MFGFICDCDTLQAGGGNPASRRVHTPSGPRKSGMPESVLMPAPVKATMCSASTIHRAIVSICSAKHRSSVMMLAVGRPVGAQAAYQEPRRSRAGAPRASATVLPRHAYQIWVQGAVARHQPFAPFRIKRTPPMVGDLPTRLLDDQRARRDIPGREAPLVAPIEPPRGRRA